MELWWNFRPILYILKENMDKWVDIFPKNSKKSENKNKIIKFISSDRADFSVLENIYLGILEIIWDKDN